MLHITPEIVIPSRELELSFARSGGPGGQNVNKVSSKVLLRWRPAASGALPEEIKARLLESLRGRLTNEGELLIVSQRYRDQPRNVEDCIQKLRGIILQGLHKPKPRRLTRPTRGSHERRHKEKRRRSETKAARKRFREE
jgi:ribosome-associated protein